jgi:hypothetical protein
MSQSPPIAKSTLSSLIDLICVMQTKPNPGQTTMSNHSSPHGGKFVSGTIIHGTLRTADLLKAFADEY